MSANDEVAIGKVAAPQGGVMKRLDRAAEMLDRWLRALDPAPHPTRLPPAFLAAFAIAVVFTTWLLVSHKYLPGQDVSYHAHCSRVWTEAGRPGSPYAAYEPGHPLEANTFMYSVAGLLSLVSSSFGAFRFVQAYYFIGLPLACLYALRSLDRSPWGSLLAFPLCYTEVFAAGYLNMAFAAPTFIFALVTYRRFTQEVTLRRGIAVAALFVVVFLSHAHVYLWLGGLVILYTLSLLVERSVRAMSSPVALRSIPVLIGSGALVAVPSLLLFWRWYARGYGSGHSVGATGNNMSFQSSMEWTPLPQKYMAGALQAFDATTNTNEVPFIIGLGLLVALAMGLSRAARDRSVPLPEIAVLLTVVSYYFLPDTVALQMVAVRQWYFVFWLTPLLVTPIPLRFGAVRSVAVVLGILIYTASRLTVVSSHMRRFKEEEMVGFDQIVAAAPKTPGLTLGYVAVNARSKYWLTSSLYHSYGFLGAQRSYDGPVEFSDKNSVAPVRYKNGPPVPVKHIYGNAYWPTDPIIWQYDLILVYRWVPTPAQEKVAQEHGTLVAAAGDWQLWQRRAP